MSRTYKDRRRAKVLRMKQKRRNDKIKVGKANELIRVANLRENNYWEKGHTIRAEV